MIVPLGSMPQYLVNNWLVGVLLVVGAAELEVPVVESVPVADALVSELWKVLETDDRREVDLVIYISLEFFCC